MLMLRDAEFILTLDAQRRVLRRASLVMDGTNIVALGKTADVDARFQGRISPADIRDASGTLLAPGFVNTHAHTFEHLSRGLIPDDLATTLPWALGYFFPFQAALTEEEAYISARLCCLDMARHGTTCFIDASILNANRYVDAVVQAIDDVGLRAVLGRGVCDRAPTDLPATFRPEWRASIFSSSTGAALDEVDALLRAWPGHQSGRIRAWATIFGLFSLCSDDLFAGVKRLADEHGTGTNFHVASSIEVKRLADEHGTGTNFHVASSIEEAAGNAGWLWPITQLHRLGVLDANVLLTHAVMVRDEEVNLLADSGTKIAHCPGAALRLAKGVGRYGRMPEMLAAGVTVSLGADGVCSCGTFDHVRLAGLAAGLFKDARMDARLIPAETALEMATINGARALLWDDEIGSLEETKKADLIQFDLERPEWVPCHDPVRTLV